MDWEFVINNALYIIPAIIIFTVLIGGAVAYPADWNYHIRGDTFDGGASYSYPPLSPLLTSLAYQNGLILPYCILLVLVIPYLLLLKITGSSLSSVVYLYASGIPFILMWGGFFPQALIHVLMLLNVLSPLAWLPTLLIGFEVHRESFFAWLLSIVVYFFKRWWNGR